MANNDEYTDEYNDEYLCRGFFVGFNFWPEVIIPDIRISSSLVWLYIQKCMKGIPLDSFTI